MKERLWFLLVLLLGCAAATAAVIMTYQAPVDQQIGRSYAEWLANWRISVMAMVRDRRYPEAERAIRSYLRYVPEDGKMRSLLGKVLCGNGNYAEAADVYYVILLNDPGNFIARNNLGVVLARKRQPDEAVRELQEAFEISGGESFIGFNLSRVYSQLGYEEKAQQMLRMVVSKLRRSGEPRIPEDAVLMDGFISDDFVSSGAAKPENPLENFSAVK